MQKQMKRKVKEAAAYLLPLATFGGSLLLNLKLVIFAPIWFVVAIGFHRLLTRDARAGEVEIKHQLQHFLSMMNLPEYADRGGNDIRCTIWLPVKNGTSLKQVIHYIPASKVGKGRCRAIEKGIVGKAYRDRESLVDVLVGNEYNDPSYFRTYMEDTWRFSKEEAHILDATRRAYLAVPVLSGGTDDAEVLAVISCDSNRAETFSDKKAVIDLAENLVPFFRYLI